MKIDVGWVTWVKEDEQAKHAKWKTENESAAAASHKTEGIPHIDNKAGGCKMSRRGNEEMKKRREGERAKNKHD